MARVIKAGASGQKPQRPPTRVIVDAGARKFIGRELFQAKQDAEHILMRAEQERSVIIAEGKKQAAQVREESMTQGASEAFSTAAAEALAAFRKRAQRYGDAADDIRALALEVVKKVLGNEPDLGQKDVDRIMQKGMAQLRARRRLRLQVSNKRLGELASERPNLMKALQSEPDLIVEAVDDVGDGFARVVTEVGGALCAEQTALDALSEAVNVREQPRQQRASAGVTNAGTAPSGVGALFGGSRKSSTAESIPDAAIEELDDDAADDTINFSARPSRTANDAARAKTGRTDDVEVIEAEEDSVGDERTSSRNARMTGPAPVAAPRRAATRVVALDVKPGSPDSDATTRHAPLVADDDDEDLELFTDDAIKSPRKRR